MKLVLGLDIGISSVGWGIIDLDSSEVIDAGVRLFSEATKENNEKRRGFRSGRRLKRRRINRKEDLIKLLKNYDLYTPIPFNKNPYTIRVKGLRDKISKEDLNIALLNICKHRGSSLEVVDDDGGKTKEVLGNNDRLLSNNRYVCEIQLERLKNEGKLRGEENNFRTIDYVKELKKLLSTQGIDDDVAEKIIDVITRRRDFSEGPGSFKSQTPYGMIYDEEGNVKVNMIEKMTGKCSIFKDELRAPKNAPSAEFFNLLNDLNNLWINGEKLDIDVKKQLIKQAFDKARLTAKDVAKAIGVDIDDISGFRIDKNGRQLMTELVGFKTIKNIFEENGFEDKMKDFDLLDKIAVTLTKTKIKKQRFDELLAYDIVEKCADELSNINIFKAYHSLSLKALHILNEELYNSDMNHMQILTSSNKFEFKRSNDSFKGYKNISIDEDAILSPVAMRAYRQAIKVVNAARKRYGEFESIVVETTRDKNSQEEKKRINDMQKRNEEINKKVNDILNNYPSINVNKKLRDKVSLYLDQDGKSAYTQQPIDLDQLIKDPSAYEIDHIIPISVSLDDSYNNKLLSTHSENQQKGKLSPYLAFKRNKFTSGSYEDYKTFIKTQFKNKRISKKKMEYALNEKDISKYENMKEFIARNLVDTSYANRLVFNTLMNYFKDNDIDTKVHTIKGNATAIFRKYIKELDKNRDFYEHHAIDALIVASIKKLGLYNKLLKDFAIDDTNEVVYNKATGEIIETNAELLLDEKYIKFIKQLASYPVRRFSWQIDTKPNRSVSDQTIYSTRKYDDGEKLIKKYKDIYDAKFYTLANDIMNGDVDKYLIYKHDKQTFAKIEEVVRYYYEEHKDDARMISMKKGKVEFKFNPLYRYREDTNQMIKKYAKKDNGPIITQIKYVDGNLGNRIDISKNYDSKDKRIVLQQISPYRTDFYLDNDTYKFVTIRYSNVFYSRSKDMYCIDKDWYESEKKNKKIPDDATFICSMHRNEYMMIDGISHNYNEYAMTFDDDVHSNCVIWKFTATSNDKTNRIEIKPINYYDKGRFMVSIGKKVNCIKKYSCDVLGNLREVKDQGLKLEFK